MVEPMWCDKDNEENNSVSRRLSSMEDGSLRVGTARFWGGGQQQLSLYGLDSQSGVTWKIGPLILPFSIIAYTHTRMHTRAHACTYTGWMINRK